MYLKEVDKLVKQGQFEKALDIIADARAKNPKDFYALAYEERVLALLHNKRLHQESTPAEEDVSPVSDDVPPMEIPSDETIQSSALSERVSAILNRAKERAMRYEFKRAYDELKRAAMLLPNHGELENVRLEIKELEEKAARLRDADREKETEDEQRSQRIALQAELERIQREDQEQQLREQASRKLAQQEKILHYISHANELFEAKRFDDAQRELVFVSVLDPGNSDAAKLTKKINRKIEEIKVEEAHLEEERKKQEQIRDTVRRHIEDANRLTSERQYDEALLVITRAYVVDPSNEDLQKCEERIIAMQDAALKQAEEEQRLVEDARKSVLAEEKRKKELDRILKERKAEQSIRKEAERKAVALHIQAARDQLAGRRFDGALSEIAKAFALDPFDEEVKRLEEAILEAQRIRTERKKSGRGSTPESGSKETKDSQSAIQYLAKSLEYYDNGNLTQALEEIDRGLEITPDQADLRKFREIVEHDLENAVAAGAEGDTSLLRYVDKARAFLDLEDADSALTEIALGLTRYPTSGDLKKLEVRAWELHGASSEEEDREPLSKGERVKMHLIASEQFREQGDFANALEEIGRAYAVDPDSKEIRKAEIAVHQAEIQQGNASNPNLKLLYGKKNAAG